MIRSIHTLKDELDIAMLREKQAQKVEAQLKKMRDDDLEQIREELEDAYLIKRLTDETEAILQQIQDLDYAYQETWKNINSIKDKYK